MTTTRLWEKSREKILNAIAENSAITTRELAKNVDLSIKGVEKGNKNSQTIWDFAVH